MTSAEAARALSHPLRANILREMTRREWSPSDLARDLHEPIGNVAYHTRQLHKLGAIVKTREGHVRGAIESYYRARVKITVEIMPL